MDWSHRDCGCGILGSTEDLVREGINGPVRVKDEKKFAARYKAAPGEILFIFRRFLFLNALLAGKEGRGRPMKRPQAAFGLDKAMRFNVTFRNLRSDDLTFVPGTLVDCGRTPSKTSAVKLNLTDTQGKRHRHLPYLGDGPPYQAICAGQIEHYFVVLHRGESLSLPLDIGKYVDVSDSKQYDAARFSAGSYSLQAEFTREPSDAPSSRPKTTNVWTGKASSNILKIQFTSEFSAPLADYAQ